MLGSEGESCKLWQALIPGFGDPKSLSVNLFIEAQEGRGLELIYDMAPPEVLQRVGEDKKRIREASSCKRQATSFRRQAFEPTCSSIKRQASSPRPQASSFRPQATRSVILLPRYMDIEKVFKGKGPRAFTMINVFFG